MKLPHWAQLVLGLLVVVIAWVMNQTASGALVLPAAVLTLLTIVKTVIGIMSDAAGVPSQAEKRGFAPFKLVLALAAAGCLFAGGVAITACPPGATVPPTVVDTGACVLDVVSKDMLAGMAFPQAVEDAAIKCFGGASAENVAKVQSLWASHLAASDRMRGLDGGGK